MATPEPDSPTPTPTWKRIAIWAERIFTVGVLVFVAVRLGPQLGAWTGVAPTLGSAPELVVPTLDGTTLTSADLQGRVVVVNFWATWCGPCRLEMPSLQALSQRHGPEDLVVLGLSVDAGPRPVQAFLEERGITYPVGMATQQHRLAFGGLPGTPMTFLIDRQGVVRHRVIGYFAPPAMKAAVDRLVAESPLG